MIKVVKNICAELKYMIKINIFFNLKNTIKI